MTDTVIADLGESRPQTFGPWLLRVNDAFKEIFLVQSFFKHIINFCLEHPVSTAQLVAWKTGTGKVRVQIWPSPIEFSIGGRLRERFYAVRHKIQLCRIEVELVSSMQWGTFK